jgi:hypothetical protein
MSFTEADRTMLKEVFEQVRKGWVQLGVNEKGQPLTLVDGLSEMRKDVEKLKATAA